MSPHLHVSNCSEHQSLRNHMEIAVPSEAASGYYGTLLTSKLQKECRKKCRQGYTVATAWESFCLGLKQVLTSRLDFRRALVKPCHSFSDCLSVSRVNFPFVSSMQSWETILSSSPCSFGFNIPTNHLAKQSPDRSATNLLEFFTCGTCCLHSGQWNTNPAVSTESMLISDTCQTQTKNFENVSMCIWLRT